MPAQGVLFERGSSLWDPLILMMLILRLHIDLEQLEDEATHNSRQWQHQSHIFLKGVYRVSVDAF